MCQTHLNKICYLIYLNLDEFCYKEFWTLHNDLIRKKIRKNKSYLSTYDGTSCFTNV